MKIIITSTLIFSILLNIILICFFVFKGNTKKTEDNLVAVVISVANRDFALEEMREFLNSINQTHKEIQENDKQLVIKAASNSVRSVIDHTPKGLVESLPIGFKKLGFATHDIFDEIKNSAQTNFNAQVTNRQLSILLNNFVACHATYKIETSK